MYRGKQFLKMFIINGKSQASTVRLAVGTGCVHQEAGYSQPSAPCRVPCRINEDVKACSARSLFESPFFAFFFSSFFAYHSVVYHTWCFPQWIYYEVQLIDEKHLMFRRSPQPCPAHPVLIKQPMHINVTDALLQNGLCGLKKKK